MKKCMKINIVSKVLVSLSVLFMILIVNNKMEAVTFSQYDVPYNIEFVKISKYSAIDTSGNLWTWGGNEYGQIGDGTTTSSYVPKQVMDGTTFSEVSSGQGYTVAIDTSGNLWAWGCNNNGQVGNGGISNGISSLNDYPMQTVPVKIKSGTKFTAISAGVFHCLAIDTSGNLWAWGCNSSGQIGNGSETNATSPVQIKSGTKFTKISASVCNSLAIDTSGNLWGWGSNFHGQLGNGTQNAYTSNELSPIQIKSGTKFKEVASGNSCSFAIDTSGNLWGCGDNSYGAVGNGGSGNATHSLYGTTIQTQMVQIKSGTYFSKISACESCLAIDTSGNLWGWGRNDWGQVGIGTSTNVTYPTQIKSGTKFKEICADCSCNAIDTNRR